MKHIITCGCSFTKIGYFSPSTINSNFIDTGKQNDPRFFKWTHWLEKELGEEYNVLNLGSQTNDNVTICRTVTYWLNEMISSGIKPKDISVIIQWSTPQRNSFYIPKDKLQNIKNREYFGHTAHYLKNKQLYDAGVFYLTGGYNLQEASEKFGLRPLLEEYIMYYGSKNIENQTLNWLTSWAHLKLLFEKYDIKNHYFSMIDIFSETLHKVGFGFYHGYKTDQFENLVLDQKEIPNTENDICWLINDELYKPYVNNLNIFENFWLYKTPTCKYGGQLEWTIQKYDKNDLIKYQEHNGKYIDMIIYEECAQQNISERDYLKSGRWYGHTSSILNRKFVIEELIPFLNY